MEQAIPTPVDRILSLLGQMKSNSQSMAIWRNVPLSDEVVSLLRDLASDEGEAEDKADVLDEVLDNLSEFDTPRHTLSILSYEEELLSGTEDARRLGEVRRHIRMLRDYIDPTLSLGEFRSRWRARSLKFDPVERTPRWEEINYELEQECDTLLAGTPRGMGFCHAYWPTKSDVLLKRYGIRWKSPSRMNPGVHFD